MVIFSPFLFIHNKGKENVEITLLNDTYILFIFMVVTCRWRVRRRDSVQTIDALAKNRIWRVMNTRDTDMYGSHQRVFPKAVWENEYILDDSRTLYGEKYGLPPWDRAGLLKIPYQENKRNSNAEATGLLMNEKNAEEHIYETIEDVRKEMAALKAREDAQEESRKEA